MKERGMIFNAEMVRAILDGRKTQTRRIVNWHGISEGLNLNFSGLKVCEYPKGWVIESDSRSSSEWRCQPTPCPFGAVGEHIWVRETFRVHSRATDVATLVYKASVQQSWTQQTHRVPIAVCNKPVTAEKWTPSLHMPRWASRITLEITGVRVERLNDISQEDAQAEGMELTGWRPTYSDPDSGGEVWTPYDNFAQLWQSIYGEESWQANPWVWVITFQRVEWGAA